MKNILLIGYDSNICLGVCYCLSKADNVNLFLLTNNKKNAGKYSIFIKNAIFYDDVMLNLNFLNEIIKRYNINLVFPYDENEGIFISEHKHLIENINTQCIWLTDYRNYSLGVNKIKLAEFLKEAGINTPHFIQENQENILLDSLCEWNCEFIMKPSRSSFGRGIVKFENVAAFIDYIKVNHLNFSNYIFQPYIKGSDITINVLAKNGEVLYFTIQETAVKTGSTFVSGDEFQFKIDNKAIDIIKNAVRKLNWNGVACFDLRRSESSGEIYILEINGRFWASLVAAYEKGGINFPMLIMQSSLGEQLSSQENKYESQVSLSTYFKSIINGKYISFNKTKYKAYLSDPVARLFQIMNR